MTHFLSQCDPMAGCGKTYPADLHNCPHCGADAAFSTPAPLDVRDWGYDIETYPNCFTACFTHAATGMTQMFEISDRRNDWTSMIDFMHSLGKSNARGVGFNNLGFDYPVMHWIAHNIGCDVKGIYDKAMSIIRGQDKFGNVIWDDQQIFQQLDLFKIWHFDNRAKSTSLKALEIVMRSYNVIDLPFPVGTILNDDQKEVLITYNKHDVKETLKFYVRSLAEIHLREQLSEKYKRNMLNFSNTKIGGTILVSQMEAAGIQCFMRDINNRKVARQTIRTKINLGEIIFPYIKFERPEFQRIVDFFHSKTLTSKEINEIDEGIKTKGIFTDLHAMVDGFKYDFGVGGIHGSIESQIVYSDDEYQIVDADVTSFYPRMAIVNNMYPEHLGPEYCTIYNSIFEERRSHPKGTPENAALKESLNASYGNSNNKYSPLFDPRYTMQTTINGQLMLCMLAEQLIKIPGLSMIQANTDGLTYRCPRIHLEHTTKVCKWWESVTGLELEYAMYSRMIIRDVNNYIAEYEGGKLKRKGAYEYNTLWHQNPSAQVVGRAAEAALVHGKDIRTFITSHRDPFDFMCRAKVPRGSTLTMRWSEFGAEQEIQHITRYFVSRNGGSLIKVSPPTGEPGTWKRKPKISDEAFAAVMRENAHYDMNEMDALGGIPSSEGVLFDGTMYYFDTTGVLWDARIHTGNKSKHDTRELSICAGWRVTECANADDFDWSELNYDWYIAEAEKLVLPLLTTPSK